MRPQRVTFEPDGEIRVKIPNVGIMSFKETTIDRDHPNGLIWVGIESFSSIPVRTTNGQFQGAERAALAALENRRLGITPADEGVAQSIRQMSQRTHAAPTTLLWERQRTTQLPVERTPRIAHAISSQRKMVSEDKKRKKTARKNRSDMKTRQGRLPL